METGSFFLWLLEEHDSQIICQNKNSENSKRCGVKKRSPEVVGSMESPRSPHSAAKATTTLHHILRGHLKRKSLHSKIFDWDDHGPQVKGQRLKGPNKKTQDTNFSMIWAKSPCTNDVNIGSNKTHMAAVAQLFATKKARSGPEKLAQIKEHGSTSTVKQQKADRIKNESLSHAWFKSMQCTSKASETESAATTVQPNIPIIPRIRGKA